MQYKKIRGWGLGVGQSKLSLDQSEIGWGLVIG
jgi:hypothetical protein